MTIKTVTVVGANGTMGTNVSAIFASFGAATVYMVSRDKEKSKKAALKAGKTVKADSIVNHLIPVDYSNLDECVKASDLVFESAAENLELKIELHTKIGKSLRKGAVACTGSSGLSITRLGVEGVPDRYPVPHRGREQRPACLPRQPHWLLLYERGLAICRAVSGQRRYRLH